MKNYIQSWRSSILSESNPLVLNEGLFDIGLPAEVAEAINKDFEGVPEKGKTMLGNLFKKIPFKQMPRRYSLPLLNDVAHFFAQIRDTTLNIVIESGKEWSSLQPDDRADIIVFFNNLEIRATGDEDGITSSETYDWKASVTDIQKMVKITKKAFSRGIIAKILGKPAEKGYIEIIERLAAAIYEDYARHIGAMTLDVQTWLKSQQDEYKKIPQIIEKDNGRWALSALRKYADTWVRDREVEEQKVHTFDDTSYWYDLRRENCPVEAERMGHCGGDSRASTLFSLRYKKKDKQKSSSYLTVSYNPDTNTIYQIKGKMNQAPEEKYYKHIAWLIKHLSNPKVEEIGEHSDDLEGFAKMADWLHDNTDADISEPKDAWAEMETELTDFLERYNNDLFYSRLFAEMGEDRDHPTFYMRGLVAVPIELEELSEEGQQKIKDGKYTRDEITEISRIMDDPRASGRLSSTTGQPLKVVEDYVIFYFWAADLVTAGASEEDWSESDNIDDLRRFGEDIMDMDREASVSGNRLQRDLARALIATGFMNGGPFLNLYMGARDGELQEDSDWIVETDTDFEDNPKLVWVQTPFIYFDLRELKIYKREEYYTKPQVVEKILNSNTFKNEFMNLLSINAMVSDTIYPAIQTWDVNFEDYNPPKFALELAWSVNDDSNERIADVVSHWLNAEYGKSDFEKMLHTAYFRTLTKVFEDDAGADQSSMDFPGGRRLSVNESISHKDMIKKWKGFKGF